MYINYFYYVKFYYFHILFLIYQLKLKFFFLISLIMNLVSKIFIFKKMFKFRTQMKIVPQKSFLKILKKFKVTKGVCSIDNPYTLEVNK